MRQALAANNYLSAVGQTKGLLVQQNLTASTDLHSVEEFKKLATDLLHRWEICWGAVGRAVIVVPAVARGVNFGI